MERHKGIPMGHPNSTVFMSSPIRRQSSRLNSFNHSLTGSVPEAVRKNLTAIILNWSLIKLCTHKYLVPYMVHSCQGAEVSNSDERYMPFRLFRACRAERYVHHVSNSDE